MINIMNAAMPLITGLLTGLLSSPTLATASTPACRCIPGDSCWPNTKHWESLNATVHGNLIRTVPVGHVCHDPTYDAVQCDAVKAKWDDPFWKTSIAEAIMTPSFANNSCNPFSNREIVCDIGGYAQYTINITKPDDVASGLAFAHRNNIRLVVKNTGHDFLGRSVGYGSLSLWTHHLKGKQLIKDYQSKNYRGPALKVQSGVQVREANEFVHHHGYMMVGGECPSVGLSGGYTAGGGQSPLSSFAGLAADQTLEFEVITANGKLLRAAPDENQDLYWALSGGGPGYGVVWSVTYRIFPDVPVIGTVLSFDRTNKPDGQNAYWQAIDYWHSLASKITDIGGYTYTGYNDSSFAMMPLFVPNKTQSQVLSLLQPFHSKLESLGVQYKSNTTEFTGYLTAWKSYFNWDFGGNQDSHIGSRLIPRKVVTEKHEQLLEAVKNITTSGGQVLEMTVGARSSSGASNAVHPAWRDADILLLVNSIDPKSTGAGIDEQVTHVWGGMLRKLAPQSGTYMNEADVYEVDFQQSFYGNNYKRLSAIKKKYDPHSVFYATTGVGSEKWQPQKDGRLCRV